MSFWRIKKESAWTFNTSGTGGAGLGFVVASGGEIVLNDPAKKAVRFHYGGVGAGLSIGLKKVPKLGRFMDPRGLSEMGGGVLAPESFPNHGVVYALSGCPGADLTKDDFKGICLFFDAGLGLIAGYAGETMLMNCNPIAFAALVGGGIAGQLLFESLLQPRAMLLSWGPNLGLQANAGVSESIGYLS